MCLEGLTWSASAVEYGRGYTQLFSCVPNRSTRAIVLCLHVADTLGMVNRRHPCANCQDMSGRGES